jgi:predicted RNA methylase
MNDLFSDSTLTIGSVECLGQTFESDVIRRAHFLKLLKEMLKDAGFRKIDGFPLGTDEDILALSDPPYFTACPNPFLEQFIKQYGKRYEPSDAYRKEPFAADVSEGKNNPIYNAHSYHTKVPHKAVMRYILHYTQPGELIFDAFCGTGMTGVAAQLCGSKSEVESLGYRVDHDGNVYRPDTNNGKPEWRLFSRLGARVAVLNDLSPVASFIAHNFNMPVNPRDFESKARKILDAVIESHGWMYQTLHGATEEQIQIAVKTIEQAQKPDLRRVGQIGRVNFLIWSDVFVCPDCAQEIVFWEAAVDREAGKVLDEFKCTHCGVLLSKRSMERAWSSYFDESIGLAHKQTKQVPVAINYSIGNKRFEKSIDAADSAILEIASKQNPDAWFPCNALMKGDKTGEPLRIGVTHAHHFYTHRTLLVLADIRKKIFDDLHSMPALGLWFTSTLAWTNRLNRLLASNYFGGGGGVIGQTLQGTLYISSIAVETNPLERFLLRISSVPHTAPANLAAVSTGSAAAMKMPDNSIDYLFFDPPFGSNIMYSELNFLWESWLKVTTNSNAEAIENRSQSKSVNDYRLLMRDCFKEAYRVLKPGRWMTVEFSNTKASVWNAIQTALQEAGFVVGNVSVLEKTHKGFKAVTTTTAVKQDLVISSYKPNGGLEERFARLGGTEESVWDFVRTHLAYLPTIKEGSGELEFIVEREPRILFDRMVAWFVRHNTPIPMSSQEFRAGLIQRFVDRDGMIFLPEQVGQYDKKRAEVLRAPQLDLFVSDERSAIDWLSDFLKRRPSTYQELHPEFLSQLGAGWKKHERRPELAPLLEANFLRYDGDGEVPSQIHTYLSSNHKDLRGLEKIEPRLVGKAKDRWYLPDPNKAQDLEKKREKAMLKEFEDYATTAGRKLKEFRLEVLRAGFKDAWGRKDYQTIIKIAQKIPEESLQEDEKLLLWYDQALTRAESGA